MLILTSVARPREFNEEGVLDKAMFVFWQRGFAGTSISDLEEATEMKRQSLYNAFGDKEQLYARALKRYSEHADEVLAPLRDRKAGLRELREALLQFITLQRKNGCRVCMVVKTAFDHQVDDPQINRAVQMAAENSRRLYATVLSQAQQAGELASDSDPDALANYIFSVFNGMSALAQTGASSAEVERTLDFAMQSLRPIDNRPTNTKAKKSARSAAAGRCAS